MALTPGDNIVTTIRKEMKINAAHVLPKHQGKCKRLHGHNYKIEVWATGPIGRDGMVMDFDVLSHFMRRVIDEPCDHQFLNEIYPGMDTTAENLSATWLASLHELDDRIWKVRVWETDTCYADSEFFGFDESESEPVQEFHQDGARSVTIYDESEVMTPELMKSLFAESPAYQAASEATTRMRQASVLLASAVQPMPLTPREQEAPDTEERGLATPQLTLAQRIEAQAAQQAHRAAPSPSDPVIVAPPSTAVQTPDEVRAEAEREAWSVIRQGGTPRPEITAANFEALFADQLVDPATGKSLRDLLAEYRTTLGS